MELTPWSRDAGFHRAMKRLFMTGWALTAEAEDLLRARAQLRRRATMWCLPLAIAAAACMVVGFSANIGAPQGTWFASVILLVTAAVAVRFELIWRSEHSLARSLPRRFGRAGRVPVTVILGRLLLLLVTISVTLQVLMLGWLIHNSLPRAAWPFGIVCAASYLFAAWSLTRTAARPAIAVDPVSLTADDRLRSNDCVRACLPLHLATLTFGVLAQPRITESSAYLLMLLPVLLNVLWNWPRWDSRYPPAPHAPERRVSDSNR